MATYSSILAGKIPWTGKPGRLQFMGSQRVRHDEVTKYACTLEDHCSQRGIYIYAYYFGVGTVQVI